MGIKCEPLSTGGHSSVSAKAKSRQDISTAYVILVQGETIDVALLRALETLHLVVKHCTENDVDDLCRDGNSIVVVDFSPFIEKRNPSVLYYGPKAIKRSVALRRRLPFTGHSMLTTLLYGKSCCLRVSRHLQKMYRLRIYALGGRLAGSIAKASFFVTSTAAGKMYDIARKLDIPIVTPKLIDYLWQRREEFDFEFDDTELGKFRLPVFQNIKMSFHGFEECMRYRLEETAIRNGAIALASPTATSLVICDPNIDACDSSVVSRRRLGVDWFYQSLAEGHAKSFSSTEIECHIVGSLTDERFLILVELCNLESKYLETIGMIVEMVVDNLGPLDLERSESRENENSIITKFQRLRIFLHFLNLHDLHKELLLRFETVVRTQDVGEIFRNLKNETSAPVDSSEDKTPLSERIVTVYKLYLTDVESLRKYILSLETENPSFSQFLRRIEDRPESGREKFVDLLMHPMQRWPRILLLLRRLSEVSSDAGENDGNTDCIFTESCRKTLDQVQEIVRELNEGHAPQSGLMKSLRTLSQIEGMPPLPWSHQYELISTSEMTLKSFLINRQATNVSAVCFVFTHGVEIVKNKKPSVDKTETQAFKHMEFIPFARITMVLVGIVLDANHVEICHRQDDFSQEQVLLEFESSGTRDDFFSDLQKLCPTSVEIHEISAADQKMRCESLLLQWYQTQKDSNVTRVLFRNLFGNVNKLF